ncbi:MAG TPA: hypothetical protein VMT05_09670, partial [Terriglobales bacterium]|nr:hypothetical protein [Terriglobales bacterium]
GSSRRATMIFGFNTAVKHGDTLYHIQSEPRERERMLETQVFVGGRCIGKRASSYDEVFFQPGSIEYQLHELLREQHRQVVEAARYGHLDEVLGSATQAELAVQFLNADSVFVENAVVMRFRVTAGGEAVPGASLTSRLRTPEAEPVFSQAVTDGAGMAEMRVALHEAALRDADILVEAMHSGRSVWRKFRLRKSG